VVVLVLGTLMYVVEGPEHGFTSVPVSIYWAITTLTTVGFGDITPKTDVGRFVASVMMLAGWGTLAVPTGIVTAEMTARRLGAASGARHVQIGQQGLLQTAGVGCFQNPVDVGLGIRIAQARSAAGDTSRSSKRGEERTGKLLALAGPATTDSEMTRPILSDRALD